MVSKLWVGVGWISVVVTVLFFFGGLLVVCGIGVVVSGVGISMCLLWKEWLGCVEVGGGFGGGLGGGVL